MKIINVIKFSALCIVAALLVAVAYFTSFQTESDCLEITFLDVGQGDCAYIKTPDNYRMMIDSGDKGSYENYIKPFLGKRRVEKLDAAVISHFHEDHFSGIYEMIGEKQIDKVYVPLMEKQDFYADMIKEKCDYNGVEYVPTGFAELIYAGDDDIRIYSLFPADFLYNEEDDESGNNVAIILMVEYKHKIFLFTGDVEQDAELKLLEYMELNSDVLKVGHHGSKTSTSDELLNSVTPEYAVISCGVNNSYGFPNEEVLKKLEDCGAKIYRTDLHGDITFTLDKDGNISITTSRQEE